jgi:hypothetical protein
MIPLAPRALLLAAIFGSAACPGRGTTGQTPETTSPDDQGPKGTTPMKATEHSWKVFDGSTLILDVSDVPGPILSTAAPPPGLVPVKHPFLSASARSAPHEHRLRELLNASRSVEDFLAGLRAAGFEVRANPAP